MALIVIADDEYLLAAMLADILEDEGYETVVASHGQEALDRIRSRSPALLITDFMMPVMTGLELAMALKSDPKTSDLPIILVSGAQGAIGRQHGELFEVVLDKPYRNDELVAAVQRLLSP